MSVSALFDDAAQARVSAAVVAAERETTGEIVPVAITRCDSYAEGRYRGALIGAGAMTLLAPLVPDTLPVLAFIALQALGFAVGYLVAGWDPIERALIGRKTLQEAAQAHAQRAFFEHGIERTEGGTGVLLFVSLFEHTVVVLGDKGVAAKVEAGAWQKVTQAFSARMREQKPVEALCDAISAAGELLRSALPKHPDAPNPNELPDHVRTHP